MAGRKIYFFGEGLGKTGSRPKKSGRLLSVRPGVQLVLEGELSCTGLQVQWEGGADGAWAWVVGLWGEDVHE
jgi:hypothetical protein